MIVRRISSASSRHQNVEISLAVGMIAALCKKLLTAIDLCTIGCLEATSIGLSRVCFEILSEGGRLVIEARSRQG